MKALVVVGTTLILCGCASSGIVPMDRGTYLITKRSGQVGIGAPVGSKAQVYKEANRGGSVCLNRSARFISGAAAG
jgi:hypothetical protein